MTEPVAAVVSAAFATVAARRGGAAVHRRGTVLGGTLTISPAAGPVGAPLLDRQRSYEVQARLSWSVGPPGRLPDLAGLALRVLDADGQGGPQDLLLSGSLPPPLDRLLVLRRDLRGWYGTPLRLRLGGPTGPLAEVSAQVEVDGGPRRCGLADVRAAAAAGRLRVLLVVRRHSALVAAGWVRLDRVAEPANPERPRFDVGNAAGGLVGAGFWHGLRLHAYAASRRGDPRVGADPARAA